MRLTVATRGSRLALRQVELLEAHLQEAIGGVSVAVSVVKTTGDKDSRPFAQIGGKGLFSSEVEREVAEGRADLAVHSAKDLTAELAEGCSIAAVLPRAPAADVVVGGTSEGDGMARLASLPAGAVVGTSSMRRRALLNESRPDLEIVELRGNLDTRLRKVGEEVDAAILAEAGIRRLGAWEEISAGTLDVGWWVPAPGQGAIAIEAREDRTDLLDVLGAVHDHATGLCLAAERAFAERMEGGCSVPLGCHAQLRDGTLSLTGFLGHPSGTSALRDRISGDAGSGEAMGRELADAILNGGGADIIEELGDSAT